MHACNLCGSTELILLVNFGDQPIVKHYLTDRLQEHSTYPFKLYFCEQCGLTQLVDSCPPEILYENYVTLSSWKFQPHLKHEIDVLKSLPDLHSNSKIIEIGSNDGIFLEELIHSKFHNVLGIEPAKDAHDFHRKRYQYPSNVSE